MEHLALVPEFVRPKVYFGERREGEDQMLTPILGQRSDTTVRAVATIQFISTTRIEAKGGCHAHPFTDRKRYSTAVWDAAVINSPAVPGLEI